MNARLKCSNCGAEISTFNFSWGRKQWIWLIPLIILVAFLPFLTNYAITGGKHDFRAELIIKNTQSRFCDGTIEILGIIENHGKVNWENIIVQADLYGKDKQFLDHLTGNIRANILPGGSEHFKISSQQFPQARWTAVSDMNVKVSDAYHSKY